jgi:hypothetical protein
MKKTNFWEEFKLVGGSELNLWFEGLSPIELGKVRARISQLEMEIAHGRYYDGWTLKGMVEEKNKLLELFN